MDGSAFNFITSDADSKTLGAFLNQLADPFGLIHGLVNNAAIGQDHLLASLVNLNVLAISGPDSTPSEMPRRNCVG